MSARARQSKRARSLGDVLALPKVSAATDSYHASMREAGHCPPIVSAEEAWAVADAFEAEFFGDELE